MKNLVLIICLSFNIYFISESLSIIEKEQRDATSYITTPLTSNQNNFDCILDQLKEALKSNNITRATILLTTYKLIPTFIQETCLQSFEEFKKQARCIHVAAYLGFNDIIKHLVKSGVNINTKDNKGWNAVSYAIFSWKFDTLRLLKKLDASFELGSSLKFIGDILKTVTSSMPPLELYNLKHKLIYTLILLDIPLNSL